MLDILYEYKQMSAFEKFATGYNSDLDGFLQKLKFKNISLREEVIKNCVEYTLENVEERNNRRQIMAAIKDAYGNPFVNTPPPIF